LLGDADLAFGMGQRPDQQARRQGKKKYGTLERHGRGLLWMNSGADFKAIKNKI
jgi:hypothetical protein